MNPAWFNEETYMSNKLAALKAEGQAYDSVSQVSDAFKAAGLTPYEHYVKYGDAEKLNPNSQFNRYEYLEAKAVQLNRIKQDGKSDWDVASVEESIAKAGLTVAEHFAEYGWQEGVNPSNSFDVSSYLADKAAKMGNGTTPLDVKAALVNHKLDPLSHYSLYGATEGLAATTVPEAEQVPADPAKPKGPVLDADGKTITLHLQSPVIAESIETADFTVLLDGKPLVVSKVAPGAGEVNYDVVLTLADGSRVPGDLNGVSVVYNPAGGALAQLTTEAGPVAPFEKAVDNQSHCFRIVERVDSITTTVTETTPNPNPDLPPTTTTTTVVINTLNITLTPPSNYVQTDDVAQFVQVDLSSSTGVVSGGAYGIVTVPRLMDGKLVQKLNTTGVDANVRLDIVASADGTDITTGNGSDNIALGAGDDKVQYTTLTSSQLGHMDTIDKFTCEVDKLAFGTEKSGPLVSSIIFKGPLSLEGAVTEAAIQGVLNSTKMETGTAYVVQNGKDFILVADANKDGVFMADDDFAVQLTGVTGMPADVGPGAELGASFL